MKQVTIEIDNKLFNCLLSPISLKVVGECQVKLEVSTSDNGYQNKDYTVEGVKYFDSPKEHINIIAIGYDKCNKFINGKCYENSTPLGNSIQIPYVFNQTFTYIN